MDTHVELSGEGAAEFWISGGESRAKILFGDFGVKDATQSLSSFIPTDVTMTISNHKGDLSIDIPAFDAYPGFVITVRGDHVIRVEQLKP